MSDRLAAALLFGALIVFPAYGQGIIKGDPGKAQKIVSEVCSACHGTDGNSVIPANPTIAGQHPEYTYRQLTNFKAVGGKPAERNNAVMAGMVAALSDEDMRNLAAYYAAQKPKGNVARDPELARLGQAIFRGGVLSKGVAACSGCHATNGAGMPAQYPRLAGQHAGYIEAQLKSFRAGERANDPNRMMRAIAAKLSDREIAAVAEYIAGLR